MFPHDALTRQWIYRRAIQIIGLSPLHNAINLFAGIADRQQRTVQVSNAW
jgi:hypothetical protein